MLGNISLSEFILIAVAALILFGPDKMPEIGRKLGRFVREFRSVTASFLAEITRDPEQRRSGSGGSAPGVEQRLAADGSEESRLGRSSGQASAGNSDMTAMDANRTAAASDDIGKEKAKPRRAPDPRRLPE